MRTTGTPGSVTLFTYSVPTPFDPIAGHVLFLSAWVASTATAGTVTLTVSWTERNSNVVRTRSKVLNLSKGAYDRAVMTTSSVLGGPTITLTVADSGEGNSPFRPDVDNKISTERRCQPHHRAVELHQSRERSGARQHHFVSRSARRVASANCA